MDRFGQVYFVFVNSISPASYRAYIEIDWLRVNAGFWPLPGGR